MKYGKIRIEEGYLIFTRHMMMNNLPCSDIIWAYMKRDSAEELKGRKLSSIFLVIVTQRKKQYMFSMSEKEAGECLRHLKMLNPDLALGFPQGGRLRLQSLLNTRDLGAIETEEGSFILPGKLLRSGDLYHLSQADQQMLKEEYNLKTVIDLRTHFEKEKRPDTILEGVEYYHIPILDEESMEESFEKSCLEQLIDFTGDPIQQISMEYEKIIRDIYSVKQFARFLDIVVRQKKGAVLWHGHEGKDRTGVATALLLRTLGVSEEVILDEYIKTNTYLDAEYNYLLRLIESRGLDTAQAALNLNAFFKVKRSYLEKVFRIIDQTYGSFDIFVKRALYLSPKAIENLQEKYLI